MKEGERPEAGGQLCLSHEASGPHENKIFVGGFGEVGNFELCLWFAGDKPQTLLSNMFRKITQVGAGRA